MYERTYSQKHQADMGIKDIAKAVRKDIKDAQKSGDLPQMKVSVRIQRYSGGQSLHVDIKEFPIQFLNAYRVKLSQEHSNVFVGNLPSEHPARELYTPLAKKALDSLQSLANAYNYNGSEIMVDYFDVNYYLHVGFDWKAEHNQNKEIAEKIGCVPWPTLWNEFLD